MKPYTHLIIEFPLKTPEDTAKKDMLKIAHERLEGFALDETASLATLRKRRDNYKAETYQMQLLPMAVL